MPVDGDAAAGYAEVKVGEVTVALHRGAMVDFAPIGGVLLQLACDDVDGEVEAIRHRGGDIAVEPSDTDWGSRHAYVRGPQGLLVEFYPDRGRGTPVPAPGSGALPPTGPGARLGHVDVGRRRSHRLL